MEWLALLIPIVGILCGIILGSLAIYYGHKKEMALIEKGLYKPSYPSPEKTFTGGLVVMGLGVAFLIGSLWAVGGETTFGVRLVGLILFFIGLALIISYLVMKKKVTQ